MLMCGTSCDLYAQVYSGVRVIRARAQGAECCCVCSGVYVRETSIQGLSVNMSRCKNV